jgi:hypothetical protein
VRTETAAHLAARIPRKTRPRYFARFSHVPQYGSASEYDFTLDFSSGDIQAETRPKYRVLEAIDGAFAQVFPEQGRATLGSIQLTLTNVGNQVLYYLGMLRGTLASGITASVPGPGDDLVLADTISNIPAAGTIEIVTDGVIERVSYITDGEPTDTLEVVARGVHGTTAADHAAGDEVQNGEQIRPGQRCQIYAGYADLDEEDYMPFQKMEVVGRRLHEDGEAFVIELADIQRTLRREAFLTASSEAPITFFGDPVGLALQVLTSTGTGTNGPFDVMPADWGLGIPEAYVDSGAFTDVSLLISPPTFTFDIRAPVTAKDWLEQEIFQPLSCYPVVTQDGLYSIRRFGGFR